MSDHEPCQCSGCKAERDAAYVKGLEMARKIFHAYVRAPHISGWWDVIQAEIDKVNGES